MRQFADTRPALKLLGLLALLFTGTAHAAFSWNDVRQEVTIAADGVITVHDERTLRASGDDDFGEAFVCILHEPDQRIELLSSSGAVDFPGQARAYSQACEDGSAGTELVVRYDTRRTQGRVLFHYELHNTLDWYSDTVHWHWELFDRNSPTVRNYRLTVNAPGPMDHPYDAVVYRFNNPELPLVTLSDDRSTLEVRFQRIPSGYGVDLRWFMDPALFTRRGDQPGLEAILQEIARAENINVADAPQLELDSWPDRVNRNSDSVTLTGSARSERDRVTAVRASVGSAISELCQGTDPFECTVFGLADGFNRITVQAVDATGRITSTTVTVRRNTLFDDIMSNPFMLIPGVLLLGWLLQHIISVRRQHRDLPSDGMLYPFEPPSDLAPAAVTSLRAKPGVAADSNGFAATVMDLARRGYLEFSGSGRNFSMLVDPDTTSDGLLGFEARALSFLQGAARLSRRTDDRGRKVVTNRELRRQGQRQTSFMSSWSKEVLNHLRLTLGSEPADGSARPGLLTPESNRAAQAAFAVGLLITLGLGAFALISQELVSIGYLLMAAVAFVLAMVAWGARRWKDSVAREVYGWQGFRRTLSDYTRMKDAPEDFFVLWDRYFVYAAALGIAQRYLRNVERLATERGINADSLAGRAVWLGAATSSDLSSLSSFASNVSSLSSSLSSALSSAGVSASSGGSSAGGGGGGGGGSSGGR